MKPAVHHVLSVVMLLSLTLFASVALADPAAPITASTLSAYWPQLVIFGCIGLAYVLRRFAPQGHFFHTDFGAWALTSSTFALSIVATTVQAKGLSGIAVVQALIGAGVTALGLSNPSVPAGTTPPMAMKKREAGSVNTSLVVALALATLLPLAACAGWQAWKTCELNKLPQVAQAVIPTIVVDLGGVDQSTAITQVENIGAGLLPDQISCIVTAIAADMAAKAATVKGEPSPMIASVQKNAAAYLKKHPAVACRGQLPPAVMKRVDVVLGYSTGRSAL